MLRSVHENGISKNFLTTVTYKRIISLLCVFVSVPVCVCVCVCARACVFCHRFTRIGKCVGGCPHSV